MDKKDTEDNKESSDAVDKEEKKGDDLIFCTSYVQDYKRVSKASGFKNLFVVPDESFEVDLDNNFFDGFGIVQQIQAWLKVKEPEANKEEVESAIGKHLDFKILDRKNYLVRPGGNEQDEYDEEEESSDDHAIFDDEVKTKPLEDEKKEEPMVSEETKASGQEESKEQVDKEDDLDIF